MIKELDFPVIYLEQDLQGENHQEHLVLSQEEGLHSLRNYFRGNNSFEELTPFVVNEASKLRGSGRFFLRVGKIGRSDICIYANNDLAKFLGNKIPVLALPRQDLDLGYQWLDFYPLESHMGVNLSFPISSYRVDRENSKVITKGWFGPERQAFIDYMSGVDIALQNLRPFKANVSGAQIVIFGYIGEKQVKTRINDPALIGQEILFRPKFDEERGYFWIEGYVEENGEERFVCTRRVLRGATSFPEVTWKGPEIQSMIDWISGKLPIKLASALVFKIDDSSNQITLTIAENKKVVFGMKDNSKLEGATELRLIPKEDNLYRWIEVCRDKAGSDTELVSYYRIISSENGDVRVSGMWIGPELQRYADYLDGSITFDKLKPIATTVQPFGFLDLFTFRNKRLSLQLGRENLPAGTIVNIIPTLDDGELILEVTTGYVTAVVRRFKYDSQNYSFRTVQPMGDFNKHRGYWTKDNIETEVKTIWENNGSLSNLPNDVHSAIRKIYSGGMSALLEKLGIFLPQVDMATGLYTDRDKRVWAHTNTLFRMWESNYSYASVRRILQVTNVPYIVGRSKRSQEVQLFNRDEAIKALEDYTQKREQVVISSEEANEQLKRLLGVR